MSSQLIILGSSITGKDAWDAKALSYLEKATLVLGESRSVTERRLSKVKLSANCSVFYLDNISDKDRNQVRSLLGTGSQTVILFSDNGMPILFDPGDFILELAKKNQYEIICEPRETSWGSACAVSGWPPPFLLVGFLSQKKEERLEQMQKLKEEPHALVLMDTPYRLEALLEAAVTVFGAQREVFMAWKIGMKEQKYYWKSLGKLLEAVQKNSIPKGEFILIIQGNLQRTKR